MLVQAISPFSTMFSKGFFQDPPKGVIEWEWVNRFPNNLLYSTNLLKTLWEKEKLLVTSNFSFSHSVFYPFGDPPPSIVIKFTIVVCKLFQFGRVKNLSCGKGLIENKVSTPLQYSFDEHIITADNCFAL